MSKCPFCDQKYHPNMVRHICAAMTTALVIALADIRNRTVRSGGSGFIVHDIDRILDKARTVKGYEDL